MLKSHKSKHPLVRDGQSQNQRFLEALDPSYPKIDDLTIEDWLGFAYEFAKEINYFDANSPYTINGDWSSFMDKNNHLDIMSRIKAEDGYLEPHLALFVSFLYLLQHVQDDLNRIPKRHLDFYYNRVLHLKNQDFTPDRVHVVFQLAKKVNEQVLIPEGTLLDAGKDDNGDPIYFKTLNDNFIGTAQVSHIYSVHSKYDVNGFEYPKVATAANSKDGLGEEPVEDGETWKAFGHGDLPHADLGFAIACENLFLQEGKRTILLKLYLNFNSYLTDGLADLINDSFLEQGPFNIYLTGENGWLGPYGTKDRVVIEGTEHKSGFFKGTTSEDNYLNLIIQLDEDTPPILPYDSKVYQDKVKFETDYPILQIRLDHEGIEEDGVRDYLYNLLRNTYVSTIKLKVAVNGMKDLSVENDQGRLDASKPFMPFGSFPKIGSNFYVGSDEVFNKELATANIDVKWQGIEEDSLSEVYRAYYNNHITKPESYDVENGSSSNGGGRIVSSNSHFQVTTFVEGYDSNANRKLFDSSDARNEQNIELIQSETTQVSSSSQVGHVPWAKGFYEYYHYVHKETYQPVKGNNLNFSASTRKGFAKLTLQNSFLHEIYPPLYAMAMMKNAELFNTVDYTIPGTPYTPVIEKIGLNYISKEYSTNINSKEEKDFRESNIQFFHLDAFGLRQEHGYLRSEYMAEPKLNEVTLIPSYEHQGSLLIGLENMTKGESINIFFQIAEETIDPLVNRENIAVEWSVLSRNYWVGITDQNILQDSTNHLLNSGIVSLVIPKDLNMENTLLDSSFTWLRATIVVADKYRNTTAYQSILLNDAKVEAVGEFVAIHTHGLEAELSSENYVKRISAETIGRMVNRSAKVKGVYQPYDSFGGQADENDIQFYTRVSERLKHKKRAVQITDYEQIILEQFPDIFQVKCLSHSSTAQHDQPINKDECWNHNNKDSFLAGGYVTCLVIPDLKNKNVNNKIYPRAPLSLLKEIQDHINQLNSFFVTFNAENPTFEEVQFELEVSFRTIGNFEYYKNKLEEDILQHLTPWAFEQDQTIRFGSAIYRSAMIHFIEQLEYVDYLGGFRMHHFDVDGIKTENQEVIHTKSDRSIIVPVNSNSLIQKGHIIKEADSECS